MIVFFTGVSWKLIAQMGCNKGARNYRFQATNAAENYHQKVFKQATKNLTRKHTNSTLNLKILKGTSDFFLFMQFVK